MIQARASASDSHSDPCAIKSSRTSLPQRPFFLYICFVLPKIRAGLVSDSVSVYPRIRCSPCPDRELSTAPSPRLKRLLVLYRIHIMATNGVIPNGKDCANLIPFSSRLREGRALAQDVWSIFKWVQQTLNMTFVDHEAVQVPRICLQTVSIWVRDT